MFLCAESKLSYISVMCYNIMIIDCRINEIILYMCATIQYGTISILVYLLLTNYSGSIEWIDGNVILNMQFCDILAVEKIHHF